MWICWSCSQHLLDSGQGGGTTPSSFWTLSYTLVGQESAEGLFCGHYALKEGHQTAGQHEKVQKWLQQDVGGFQQGSPSPVLVSAPEQGPSAFWVCPVPNVITQQCYFTWQDSYVSRWLWLAWHGITKKWLLLSKFRSTLGQNNLSIESPKTNAGYSVMGF